MQHLLDSVLVTQVLGYFAAGTTKRTSSIVDVANWDGVLFAIGLGTILDTGTLDAYVEQHTLNQTSGMARLAGQVLFTVTATEAALVQSSMVIDVYRPVERYLQCNITPAVANAVVLGITAIRYSGRKNPASLAGMLKTYALASPAEA